MPLGEQRKGKLSSPGFVAEGTDNYQVLDALAEVDPSIHVGEVPLADSVDDNSADWQTIG